MVKVYNYLTKRQIKVDGKIFNDMIKNGHYYLNCNINGRNISLFDVRDSVYLLKLGNVGVSNDTVLNFDVQDMRIICPKNKNKIMDLNKINKLYKKGFVCYPGEVFYGNNVMSWVSLINDDTETYKTLRNYLVKDIVNIVQHMVSDPSISPINNILSWCYRGCPHKYCEVYKQHNYCCRCIQHLKNIKKSSPYRCHSECKPCEFIHLN